MPALSTQRHDQAASEVDHIKRIADGGGDDDDNLQALCPTATPTRRRRRAEASKVRISGWLARVGAGSKIWGYLAGNRPVSLASNNL